MDQAPLRVSLALISNDRHQREIRVHEIQRLDDGGSRASVAVVHVEAVTPVDAVLTATTLLAAPASAERICRQVCDEGFCRTRCAEQIFGYTSEEAIGRPITILIPPDRQDEELAIIERVRRGERVKYYETVRQKDGSLIVLSLSVSPIRTAEGEIAGASKIARDITERKRSEEQIATLAREAEHRVKNVLATVQATINLSQSKTLDGLKRAIEGRIQALANVHALFVKSRWNGAELSSLVVQELAPYLHDKESRANIDGPQLLLEANTAQTIAITLHELATNAAKYGALSLVKGRIEVKWSLAADDRLILTWTENGGPAVKKPTRQGFGTRVMERLIRDQHKGDLRLDWRAEGLACEIILPV
jgi:PAS domain S-box-containing protein